MTVILILAATSLTAASLTLWHYRTDTAALWRHWWADR